MFHSPKRKNITLALQGGGSHGAFTWGVLDRLLEEDGLTIEGVSGTSAGAMNGALLVHGFAKGGAGAARRTLDSFWERLGSMSPGMSQRTFMGRVLGGLKISASPGTMTGEILQRMFSLQRPHAHYVNPLRGLLEETIDIGAIRAYEPMKLFVAATDVERGRARVFSRPDLTIDALMASACLPYVFPAVEIGGKPYWDGAFTGNPSLFPLIENGESPDIVIVLVTPLSRPGTPRTPPDIFSRMNDITFNAPFINELRAIALAKSLVADNLLKNGRKKRFAELNVHVIEAESEMRTYGSASKFKSNGAFLQELKNLGRRTAEAWLRKNYDAIGQRSTVSLSDF